MYTVLKNFTTSDGIYFVKGQTVEVIATIGIPNVEIVKICNENGQSFKTTKSLANKFLTKN